MGIFDWLFKNKESQKDNRKEEGLKVYKEVEGLIETYYKELIKHKVYHQYICEKISQLYLYQLKWELEHYLKHPKHSPSFNDADEVFNRITFKIQNSIDKFFGIKFQIK